MFQPYGLANFVHFMVRKMCCFAIVIIIFSDTESRMEGGVYIQGKLFTLVIFFFCKTSVKQGSALRCS